nr:MAG TPA: hypothetical protein [Microviridae sp.]
MSLRTIAPKSRACARARFARVRTRDKRYLLDRLNRLIHGAFR